MFQYKKKLKGHKQQGSRALPAVHISGLSEPTL